ncbi:MAG: glycosyltransferase family 87 protein [Candidatus Omnitrophota bacterium]|nr:glycosyltransferase family 87 protein [Candidatus Omnitrophota bacterium]
MLKKPPLMRKHNFDKNFLIFSAIFFIIFLILSIYYFTRIYQPWGTSWTDFTVMHRAGQRIIKGEPIYDPSDSSNYGIDLYKYSPAFACFMSPFTKVHMHISVPIWYLFTFILILSSIYLVKRIIIESNKEKSLPVYFYFLSFFLTLRFLLVLLSRVQSDFLVLFFLVLSIWFLRLKREVLSGFSLATAIMVKITPLIFIPYFIYRKFYKAAFASCAGILLYLWLPSLNLGWEKNVSYLKGWLNLLFASTPELILWYKNQSLLSCIFRLFSGNSPVRIFLLPPLLIKGIFLLIASLMIFFALYFCRNLVFYKKKEFSFGHLLEFSLILICMVLFSPLAWKHTFLHLLVGHMVLVYYLMKNHKDKVALVLVIASFVLNSILNPEVLKSLDDVVSLYSNMTAGTLLLYMALLRAAYRLRGSSYAE